jgi:hypothetical protein
MNIRAACFFPGRVVPGLSEVGQAADASAS